VIALAVVSSPCIAPIYKGERCQKPRKRPIAQLYQYVGSVPKVVIRLLAAPVKAGVNNQRTGEDAVAPESVLRCLL
jgi:hypothetical protein